MKHVVMYSGGACSWATAMRVKKRHPDDEIILLFADTKMEDEDLYRFLDDSEVQLGVRITRIADGRTPWELMADKHSIFNNRMAACSDVLKRKLLTNWVAQHCEVESTAQHFGLDWTELHRLERLREAKRPWRCEAYMTEAPYLSKREMTAWMSKECLIPPRLYGMGFSHNNCGGFCVRAGVAHFANLLAKMPERYAYHEKKEQEMREYQKQLKIDGDYSILRGQTLKEFRLSIEAKTPFDEFDFGGCGCAV